MKKETILKYLIFGSPVIIGFILGIYVFIKANLSQPGVYHDLPNVFTGIMGFFSIFTNVLCFGYPLIFIYRFCCTDSKKVSAKGGRGRIISEPYIF